MIADTRTNAGLDNVSTFRKLHVFSKPGERIMAIASAGNLAISQSVLSTLTEGLEDPITGEVETLLNAPTMFQAAQRIGRAIRAVNATEGVALKSEDINFDVSFLFGGQIKGSRMRLFMIYPAGNFIECASDSPLMAPPKPIVSSGRFQAVPFSDTPPEMLRSTSVNDRISFCPSFQLKRPNTPRSLVIACSPFR